MCERLSLRLIAALVLLGVTSCGPSGDSPGAAAGAPTGSGAAKPSASSTQRAAQPQRVTMPPPRRVAKPSPLPTSGHDYVFPVRGCSTSYGRSGHHYAYPKTTIWAHKGCAFVAPVAGTVHEVNRKDTWDSEKNKGGTRGGKYVSIIGVDGVRYYGSHLAKVAKGIKPGTKVKAGQPLGKIGNSGDAHDITTNLHFGISWPTKKGVWWIRRGTVFPWPYLDAWQRGLNATPRPEVMAKLRRVGKVPECQSLC